MGRETINESDYGFFLNGHSIDDGLVNLALTDFIKSGLLPEIQEQAQIKIFRGTQAQLKELLGFTSFKGQSILQAFKLIEFPYFNVNGLPVLSRFKLIPSTTNEQGKEKKYLHPLNYPPIPYILPLVWQAKDKVHKPIWITEGEKKALKLIQHHELAIALPGIWNFKAGKNSELHLDKDLWGELKCFEWQGRTIYLAFDMDFWSNPQVRYALWELALKLYSLGGIIKYPTWKQCEGKGIDDYLVYHEKKGKEATATLNELKEKAKDLEDFMTIESEEAIIRALSMAELPTIKFERVTRSLAKKLGINHKTLVIEITKRKDLNEIKEDYTEEEKEDAMNILKSPKLIAEFLDLCHFLYLGREKELLLVKLATISRKMKRGISIIITGTSSVGKSELVRTVLQTVYPEDREDFTRISENYLLYRTEPLDHKVITFFEIAGGHEAYHIIRTALSEGVLTLGTVINDAKKGLHSENVNKSTEGLTMITTFASGSIDWELDTRVLKIELTHTEELGKEILNRKAEQSQNPTSQVHKEGMDRTFKLWQIADRLIEPGEVIIPYAKKLSSLFPAKEERYMRDFDKVLSLIKTSALLHQYKRAKDKQGNIIATQEDYRIVYSLGDLIAQSVSPITAPVRKFLETVLTLTIDDIPPLRPQIQEELKVSKETIKRYVKTAKDKGLIETEGKGKNQKLKILEIPEPISSLPNPEILFSHPGDPMTQNGESLDTQGKERVNPCVTLNDLNDSSSSHNVFSYKTG